MAQAKSGSCGQEAFESNLETTGVRTLGGPARLEDDGAVEAL
jgi:hypothetical protein